MRLRQKVCYRGFQGWGYLDLEKYRKTPDGKMNF
jgi:hypothetical protein